MGSAIEKVAFQPPDPRYTRQCLGNDPRVKYVPSGGHDISLMVFNEEATSGYTVLLAHGNAEDLGHGLAGFEELARQMNVQLATFDYSGYGLSGGRCSEKQAYRDIRAAFGYVRETLKVPKERIIVCGRSLGSGVATDFASTTHHLGGLCLLSPLASASQVAISWLPSALDIFCNDKKIGKVRTFPVHIVHGEEDEVVPFAHGKKLVEVLEQAKLVPVTHMWAPGCGHNDIEARMPRAFYQSLRDFVTTIDNYRVHVRPTLPTEEDLLREEGGGASSCGLLSCSLASPSTSPSSCSARSEGRTEQS